MAVEALTKGDNNAVDDRYGRIYRGKTVIITHRPVSHLTCSSLNCPRGAFESHYNKN